MNYRTNIIDEALADISSELDLIKSVKLYKNQKSKNKYYSILFLCQVFELASDIKILIQNNSISSAEIIIRSITDCLYSIWNMEKDPEFIKRIAFKALSQDEKRIRCLNRDYPKNMNHGLYEYDYLKYLKDSFGDVIEPSDLEKYKNIHGNETLYRMVYSRLSNYVHNNVITLENKFIKNNNGKLQIHYDRGIISPHYANKLISAVVVSIYCSLVSVLSIYNKDASKYQVKLKNIVDNLCTK